jgi:DNA polymerase type B, organellar and viral
VQAPSLNLLNSSLNTLSKQFEIDNGKGLFPYAFATRAIIQNNYEGITPDKSYYPSITDVEYQKEISNTWN